MSLTFPKGASIKDVRPTPPRGGLAKPDKTGCGGGRGGVWTSEFEKIVFILFSFFFVKNHICVSIFEFSGAVSMFSRV